MPELPEVETTKKGLEPYILNSKVKVVNIHFKTLRWPIALETKSIEGLKSTGLERRAKYLLWHFKHGSVVMHLGMSGKMRIVSSKEPLQKHDHFEVIFANGKALRFNDPRRFGAVLWQAKDESLELLDNLGPEPLTDAFDADYLHQALSKRKGAIKNAIMTNQVVVGVGNIYASEALFLSGIKPTAIANKVSKVRLAKLVDAIKQVLTKAIAEGGTTLKDFTQTDGNPGYFAQQLNVYGRDGEDCFKCESTIKRKVIGQRASYYCGNCQR
ncbi:MAG: bifunctional DNA-formamidopyrimidine glycosylase/DNA-(apurinic or apyrimidinic site) lyase [Gammaproteobacteria bacterium]|nr:bifunctional DNA-formamidopyrimidine glycosylase/DNA-(apurinic or apyrimidinic site) lyase [Gammaproteobacteria bacterium]